MGTYGRAPCNLFHGMDVAIIGAGTAGLEAARVLSERGLAVELIEATDYVGGRVRTVRATGAAPIELGPEFVHGKPELLRSLCESLGHQPQLRRVMRPHQAIPAEFLRGFPRGH